MEDRESFQPGDGRAMIGRVSSLTQSLTEADVRRIVQEELTRFAERMIRGVNALTLSDLTKRFPGIQE